MHEDRGRVLILAGSDSGGGAGVQADIKTVTALGGYAATAITAVTVQNSLGVSALQVLGAPLVEAQARAVLEDLGADAIKTGMLGDAAIIEVAARLIAESGLSAVIDPVMIAKGGAPLLEDAAVDALINALIPHATLLTPNAPEAEALTGIAVTDEEGQRRAGEALLSMGATAVLVKGGHIPGERVVDLLLTPVSTTRYETGRIETRHTHGTGCTLASAVATGLAQGLGLERSVERARDYLLGAIRHAPGLGAGHGPIDHSWLMRETTRP